MKMTKTMKYLAAAFMAVLCSLLSACGGSTGGHSGSSEAAIPATGTLTVNGVTKLTLVVADGKSTAPAILKWAAKDYKAVVKVTKGPKNDLDGTGVSGTQNIDVSVGSTSFVLWDGTTRLASAEVDVGCADGAGVNDSGVCGCPSPTVPFAGAAKFAGARVCGYPVGVTANGVTQLPSGCNLPTMQCFKDSLINGKTKVSATDMQYNSRPVMVYLFQAADSNMQLAVMAYGDDGTLIDWSGYGTSIVDGGTIGTDVDWGVGKDTGYFFHSQSNGCAFIYLMYGNPIFQLMQSSCS